MISRLFASLISLWVLSLCVTTPLSAQDKPAFDLQLGPEYVESALNLPPSIIGVDASGYYLFQNKAPLTLGILIPIRLTKESVFLRKFDKNLKPVESVELDLRTKGVKERPEFAVLLQGNIFLFSTLVNASQRSTSLMSRVVSPASMKIPATGKKIATASFDGFPRDKDVDYNMALSRDSSKVLIYYQLPNKANNPERFAVHVFDYEMTPLWDKTFELPYQEGLFDIRSFRIDNEANVYVLGKNYRDLPRERVNGAPNYNFKLLTLNPGLDKPEEITLDLRGKFLVDMHMEVLRNQDIVCAGVYAEERSNFIKGIYYFTYDPLRREVKTESSKELNLSMFDESENDDPEIRTKGQQRRSDRAFYNYEFEDIILRADGGAVLVGEEQYVVQMSDFVSTGNGSGYYNYYYIYYRNDIITINISPEGQVESASRIPKRQAMRDTDYLLSYATLISQQNIHFIFNDRIENLDIKAGERARPYSPSNFARARQVIELVSMDIDGNYVRQALVNTKEADQFAVPQASVQISPTEMILVFQRGKVRRLARVSVNP